MNVDTGQLVWLSGCIKSQLLEKEELAKIMNHHIIVGKDYDALGNHTQYRFLTKIEFEEKKAALVLGYSNRNTGYIDALYSGGGILSDDPPEYVGNSLRVDSTHKVVMVMPLGNDIISNRLNRYHKPIPILAEQIWNII